MKKHFFVIVLSIALTAFGSLSANAQVSNTGPAGLARQMPRIYGPYMANRARIRYHQRHGHQRRHSAGHTRQHVR